MCEWISRLGIYYVGKSRFIIAAWGVCSAKVEEDGSLSKKTTIEFSEGAPRERLSQFSSHSLPFPKFPISLPMRRKKEKNKHPDECY